MKKQGSGWKGESRRHSLARKGVKTVIDDNRRLAVNNYVSRGEITAKTVGDIEYLDYDEIMDEVKRYRISQQMLYDFTLELENELKQLEGKQITKRIETYLKNKYPNHRIYLQNQYGWWEIVATIPNMPDRNFYPRWMLRYDSEGDNTINVGRFKELNQWAYLEKERGEELDKAMPKLKKAVEQYNRGAEMINDSREITIYDGYKDIYPLSKFFRSYDKGR